jgi:hypothetical protein
VKNIASGIQRGYKKMIRTPPEKGTSMKFSALFELHQRNIKDPVADAVPAAGNIDRELHSDDCYPFI